MRVRAQWNESCTLAETVSILRDLSLRHCREAGSVASEISSLIEAGDFRSLCEYEIDYSDPKWSDIGALIHARQALAFWQKLEPLEIGVDKEKVAFSKFVQSESECLRTNQVFSAALAGGLNFLPRDCVVLYRARRKIEQILGPVPALSELRVRFGPGATTTVKRCQSSPRSKFAAGIVCSYDLYASGKLSSALREVPHWTAALADQYYVDQEGWLCESLPVSISPGKLQFVPKNAKTYRSIVVEPVLNSCFQLGIGDYMERRLFACGISIRDQSRNASLARSGSISGALATLDLSSASDTVSRDLVKFLLPPEWYALLSSFRTSEVTYRGNCISLSKFSSMGNGFTFPLETLIFWSLVWAASLDGEIGVYGDDIICKVADVVSVTRTLRLCGFSLNWGKSYIGGPFRESCGHDYYLGFDIRPYYQKHLVSGQSLFNLHNFYFRHHDDDGCKQVLGFIPEQLRIFGPDGYGDGHLLSEDTSHLRRSAKMAKLGYGGYAFDSFRLEPRRLTPKYPGDWVSPLYSVYVRGVDTHSVLGVGVFPEPIRKDRRGLPLWGTSGTEGYKRIKIYTLSAS